MTTRKKMRIHETWMRTSMPKSRATRTEPGIVRAYWSSRGAAHRSRARAHDRPRGPEANADRARRRRCVHARAPRAHRLRVREAVLRARDGAAPQGLGSAHLDGDRFSARRAVTRGEGQHRDDRPA